VGFKKMPSIAGGQYPVKRDLGDEPLALLKRIMGRVSEEGINNFSPK
jgi:hypothetical protein